MDTISKSKRGRPRCLSLEVTRKGEKLWRFGKDIAEGVTVEKLGAGGGWVVFDGNPHALRALPGYPRPGRWTFERVRGSIGDYFSAPPVEDSPPSRLELVRADLQAAGLSDDVLREFDEHARRHPNAGHAFARSALGNIPPPSPRPPERVRPIGWHPLKEESFARLRQRLPMSLWPIEPFNFGFDELDQWTGAGEDWPLTNAGEAERMVAEAKAFLTARGMSWEYEDPDACRDDDEDEAPPASSILTEIENYEV